MGLTMLLKFCVSVEHEHSISITIWLFNIAMERSTIFKNGKPSISMGYQQTMAM